MTLKSNARVISIFLCSSLLAGCLGEPEQVEQQAPSPLLCDTEEMRIFTPYLVQWRSQNDAENLRKDIRTNQNIEAYCLNGNRG